jgi:hypothetical protein
MNDNATYICDPYGEEIVVPVDLSAGPSQEYVEDCPGRHSLHLARRAASPVSVGPHAAPSVI